MICLTSSHTGIEAFEKSLETLFSTGGEIWLKFSHNVFFKGFVANGGLTELYTTKGESEARKANKKINNPYEYLRNLSESQDGGVFFIPSKPQGAPVKACVKQSDLLSCEMDGGTTEEQWERLNYFTEKSGLIFGAIIGSGGKSLHGHIVLTSQIGIDTRTHWQRLLAIAMLSDPAVINPHQPMRLPGFFRKEKNREQTLESYSETQYNHQEIWEGFRKFFEAEGYQFFTSFTTERWAKLYKIVANKDSLTVGEQKAEIKRILSLSEEEINPPRQIYPIENFTYSGDTIPLAFCLPKKFQNYVATGLGAGSEGRNPTALKIASVLIAWEDALAKLGINFSGNSYQLVSAFGSLCNPPLPTREIDRVYRNAQKSHITIDEDEVKAKVTYWQNRNKSNNVSYKSTNNAVISEDNWFNRFKIPEFQKELTRTLRRSLKRFFNRNQRKQSETKTKGFAPETTPQRVTESSAIVLWKPPLLISLPYVPGQLPTVDEWRSMGCPKIIFNNGERLALYGEAAERGFKITLDTTPAGHGKSHESGLSNLETFGIDPNDKENKTRIFYLSPDHRNPTTETVEINYVDLEARHPGLNYDYTRKTALGKPHVNRANKNQTPDIPSNCPENQTFLTVAELGLPVFGGEESPICQSCPLLSQGCSFLENRRHTLNNERLIRADINSISPSSDDILILDDLSLVNTHQISIKIDELLKTVGRLQLRDDDRIFKVLRLILVAVYKALQTITTEKHKYGIPHRKVMELMPTVDELNDLIWELYADDWLKADNVWGTPIWHYEMINGEPVATKVIGEDSIAPSLIDLKNECYKIFENYAKFINGLQTPEEKQQAIKDNVIPSWLPALIDCLLGNERINLSIDNGKLTITKLSKRHRNIVKNAGFVIALDATQSKQDYALSLGISPDEVLEVAEVKRPTPNLIIHNPKGLSAGKQRRETMQRRIDFARRAIANRHPGQKIALIDHKSAMDAYDANDAKKGYWYRDTRGSNQFLDSQVFVLVGKPTPNLGQMAAEYQALTGYSPTPDKLTGHYGAWVKRKIQAELIQGIGRPRAHLRPGEQIHIYLVADLDDETISAIRLAYPTASVTTEDIYDIAPEAASKGVQTARAIVDAVFNAIQDGITPKITEIADTVGKAVGTVSESLQSKLGFGFKRLVEISEMLLEAINNKTENFDLPDDARWIAETYLPNAVADFERKDTTPVDVVADIIMTAKAWGQRQFRQILAATPIPTLCKLLGAVLRFIPKKLLEELLPISPQLENA